jgi:hypothetical protein
MLNLTLRALTAHAVLSRSPFFVSTAFSSRTSFLLASSYFHKFAHPVAFFSPSASLSFTAFDTFFHKAKALSMEFDLPEGPCKLAKKQQLGHQELLRVCITMKECRFVNCTGASFGGAVEANRCNLTIQSCFFSQCSAQYGGSVYLTHLPLLRINLSTIVDSTAERFGGMYADTRYTNVTSHIANLNVTHSRADVYIGGIRLEVTTPDMFNVAVSHSRAPSYGGIWDWSTKPALARYFGCRWINCSSDHEGSSLTFFHWIHRSILENCQFAQGQGPKPKYIYLYSSESVVKIGNCWFDDTREMSIGDRYGENTIDIADTNQFAASIPGNTARPVESEP